jgi:hypothetical protein
MVEKFLHALLRRKFRFHIAFFANNSRLCIPPDSPSGLGSRYLLARETIIQHLCRNLQNVTPSVEVKLFNGYLSSEFEAYLASSGAYFFMCHDGASGGTSRFDIVQDDLSESDESSESDGSGDDKDDADDDESMPVEEVRSKIGFRSMRLTMNLLALKSTTIHPQCSRSYPIGTTTSAQLIQRQAQDSLSG